jgi:hypothetical protein
LLKLLLQPSQVFRWFETYDGRSTTQLVILLTLQEQLPYNNASKRI